MNPRDVGGSDSVTPVRSLPGKERKIWLRGSAALEDTDGKRRGASLPAAVQKLFASSPNTCLLSWVKGKMTHEPEISFGNRSIPS
jgi:hypothetical protein